VRTGWRRRAGAIRRATAEQLSRHDVLLLAAGVTLYALLAAVPLTVVCCRVAAWLAGDGAVTELGDLLGRFIVRHDGGGSAGRQLVRAAAAMPWPVVAVSVVPASLYADGVGRALTRLAMPERDRPLRRALRSRLLALAGFALLPLALIAVAVLGATLTSALGTGAGARLLGVYLAFLVGWLLATVALALTYRLGSAARPRPVALAWGAAATGSFVAGMTLGVVLLLRLPVNFGRAYAGYDVLGIGAALVGWLWLLHVVTLVGFVATLRWPAGDAETVGAPS
jgi:membrane protein